MSGANNTWSTYSNNTTTTTTLSSSTSTPSNNPQSGIYHIARPTGTTSYSFMWSYPNMIPLNPDDINGIWSAIKPYKFTRTFGGFMGQDVRGDVDLRGRVLESMKIFVGGAGHSDHPIMSEEFVVLPTPPAPAQG